MLTQEVDRICLSVKILDYHDFHKYFKNQLQQVAIVITRYNDTKHVPALPYVDKITTQMGKINKK